MYQYKNNLKSKIIFSTILLITTIIFTSNLSLAQGELLKVHFIDVGQADSALIELPNQQTILIDGGNNADGPLVVDYIKSLGISKIDYLIGTHPHEDHIGGLDNVIYSFNIGKIYLPDITYNTKTFKDVLIAAKRKGISVKTAKGGGTLISAKNLKIDILAPLGRNYDDVNDWSIVTKISYQDTSFLFTGDAEATSEHEMLAAKVNLKADLLKVGHHGSASSTTALFLRTVNPKYGVISVGKDNNYGHPDPIILNRLNLYGVKIYRTDKQGTIVAVSDGKHIKFNTSALTVPKADKLSTAKLKIIKVDLSKEIVTIKNTGKNTVDISGWQLVSVRGKQTFIFPTGITIKANDILKVTSGPKAKAGPKTLKWTGNYIWNNDGDPAQLYNQARKLVDEY